jgi:vacuolar-type H+-ATPase subunit H
MRRSGWPNPSLDGGVIFMADPTLVTGLSPLDQIRQAEAEVTRKIVAAREASEHAITEARAQAALLKKQAHASGNREGQIRYKEIVSSAEEETRTIVEHAHNQAEELRRKGQSRMEMAIQEVTSIVLCLKRGRK